MCTQGFLNTAYRRSFEERAAGSTTLAATTGRAHRTMALRMCVASIVHMYITSSSGVPGHSFGIKAKKKKQEQSLFQKHRLGYLFEAFWINFGSIWGSFWYHCGAKWRSGGHFGLRPLFWTIFWTLLGSILDQIRITWDLLGPSWDQVGAILGPKASQNDSKATPRRH